ncbi:MAG TPA: lipoyl synthase [Candidatus Hydrogenedentes bacterium]|nr:lipoyl synthase [Candidatus Hydrogenedentota bacterium]HOV61494.1 lipoyl synthase [Candidatus Hydrogenedentota bacterium]HPO29709.1 lipoyl synthase [Candidatus Hydrogenedentota bacterium]
MSQYTPRTRQRFPEWLVRPWSGGSAQEEVRELLDGLHLHTVCQSARCPNLGECWARRTATFMILGNTCTRHCRFCAVRSGTPLPVDETEPERVAEAVRRLGLAHTVVTMVTRDDLPDGGAGIVARTIRAIRKDSPATTVEVLTSDFGGCAEAIRVVTDAAPDVFGHNIETVRRVTPRARDRRFSYEQSLQTLAIAREQMRTGYVKSAFMLGWGEEEVEVMETLRDLRGAGCDIVAIGQYLQPSQRHGSVRQFIHPDIFRKYEAAARDMGFRFAVAGPFVRSSYRAEAVFNLDSPSVAPTPRHPAAETET